MKALTTPATHPELFRKGVALYVFFVGGGTQGFHIDKEAKDDVHINDTDIVIAHGNGGSEHINRAHVLWFRVYEIDIRIKKAPLPEASDDNDDDTTA